MSNHFPSILKTYLQGSYQLNTQAPWVLVSLVEKHGSSYRNVGALMMVDPAGRALGGLSGGCLERDIIHQAYKVSVDNKPRVSIYDTRDPDDNYLMHQTGCQGLVHVLFTPVDALLHQQLGEVYTQLQQGHTQFLALSTNQDTQRASLILKVSEVDTIESIVQETNVKAAYQTINGERYCVVRIEPAKRLLVVGGGYDAEPLVTMAKHLGWHVSVWDDRLHYAKASKFESADQVIRFPCEERDKLLDSLNLAHCDAIVLMTHHLGKDAAWLTLLEQHISQREKPYLAMIGPLKRKEWVFDVCEKEYQWNVQNTWIKDSVHSPAGLDIGGDTPESVALSILAQAHQVVIGAC